MAAPINPREDNFGCLASFRRGHSESNVFRIRDKMQISTRLRLRGGGRVLLRLSITEARNLGHVLANAADEAVAIEEGEYVPE
jgi:hypothetical protein